MSNKTTAVGSNGTLEITDDGVLIRRKADVLTFLNQGLQGDKTIPWRSITAVQFKAAGKHMTGYIQFSAHGHVEPKRGLFPHVNDENCVLFLRDQQGAFDLAKVEIDARIRALSAPPHTAPAAPGFSAASELEKLAALLDKGLLTREEFDERKKLILSSLHAADTVGSMQPPSQAAALPAKAPLSPRPAFPHPEPLQNPHYDTAARSSDKSVLTKLLLLGAVGLVIVVLIAFGKDTSTAQNRPSSPIPSASQASSPPPYLPPSAPSTAPPAPALAASQGQAGQRVTRTAQGANLRSSAGMEGSVVRQVPANAAVTILETCGNWVRVSYEGSTGWIFKSLVQN